MGNKILETLAYIHTLFVAMWIVAAARDLIVDGSIFMPETVLKGIVLSGFCAVFCWWASVTGAKGSTGEG